MVLGQNQSFDEFPIGGVPIVCHFASPVVTISYVHLMAQMTLNWSVNNIGGVKSSWFFFIKVDDETSAIVTNTCNKIVALKIDQNQCLIECMNYGRFAESLLDNAVKGVRLIVIKCTNITLLNSQFRSISFKKEHFLFSVRLYADKVKDNLLTQPLKVQCAMTTRKGNTKPQYYAQYT